MCSRPRIATAATTQASLRGDLKRETQVNRVSITQSVPGIISGNVEGAMRRNRYESDRVGLTSNVCQFRRTSLVNWNALLLT